jgi:hypothetical protein
MAQSNITKISNGISKIKLSNGGYKYILPNSTIIEVRDKITIIPIDGNDSIIIDFENLEDKYSTTNAVEYVEYLISNGFFASNPATTSENSSLSATVLFTGEQATLANGAEIDTGFLDLSGYSKLSINTLSDTVGLTFRQTIKALDTGIERVVVIPLSSTENPLTVPSRLSLTRIQIQNNSGSPINSVTLQLKAWIGGDGASVTTLASSIVPQSQYLLTRSVMAGNSAGQNSTFTNVVVNENGAILIADYGTEVAQSKFPNQAINKKFGRNSDIDVGGEDVWNGGGIYTGHNCTVAETLEFFSDNASDVGSLIDSGTATDGSSTTLIDAGATFITDGVVVGDLLINDTQKIHGIISSLTETVITVYDMTDTVSVLFANDSGDSYRIAEAIGAGAAVCKVSFMLDSNYDEFSEYIILNGTTAVDSVGTYLRHSSGKIILAGSGGDNQGEIVGRQKTTTANVTMVMPSNSGQTAICATTVPRGEIWTVKELEIQMARSNGAAGSAQVRFRSRKRGESWQTKRSPEITTSLPYLANEIGGLVFTEFTDLKWGVVSVSDTNTIVSAEFEYFISK